MTKILVVDQSSEDMQKVRHALGPNYDYLVANSFQAACEIMDRKEYDLIITDIGLSGGRGYELCEKSRDACNKLAPVIVLTSSNSIENRIMGFSFDIDDFIAKPFDPFEFKIRIESRLRKSAQVRSNNDLFMVGDLEIDRRLRKVSFATEGHYQDLFLTPIEFRILLCLARDVGRVYSRAELMLSAWGENIHVCQRSVDTHVSKLRIKLGDKSEYVGSVASRGYRLQKEIIHQSVMPMSKDSDLHDILDFDTCWNNNLLEHFM